MAKENEKPEENTEETGEKKKSGGMMLIIIIAVVVLLGGGVGGFFGYQTLTAKEDDGEIEEVKEKKKPEKDPLDYGVEIMIPEKAQTFNLKDTRRYINLQLKIVVPEESVETQENIKKRESQIMDTLINILNEKTVAELKTTAGMEDLKNQIRSRITTFISEDEINEVLITKYLIQ